MKLFKDDILNTPDEKLVSLVSDGNKAAFSELVNRHLTPVFRLSYSLIQDTGKAEDITQETFITLWEKSGQYKPTGQLKSWLFRIARNKTIDTIRSKKDHVDIENVSVQDGGKSPFHKTLSHEITDIVMVNMHNLPARQREALTLVHLLECTNIEAAQTMEVSVDALESLLRRGRSKMKNLLRDHKDLMFKEAENE